MSLDVSTDTCLSLVVDSGHVSSLVVLEGLILWCVSALLVPVDDLGPFCDANELCAQRSDEFDRSFATNIFSFDPIYF